MGKLTYVLKNERTGANARVIVDGTDVHASHPRGEPRLISFKTGTTQAALVKFQDVIKQHFHPRDGWVLDEKRPGVAEYPEWPKPPTEAELAEAAAAERQRKLGYVVDGDWMALDLSKQRTISDLEIALEHATGVTVLWALTTNRGDAGPPALFTRLHAAIPGLRELFIDNPWEPLNRACTSELRGLDAYLAQHKTLTRLQATGMLPFTRPLVHPALTTLSLCADPFDHETLAQVAARITPKLKTLQLCLSVEAAPDGAAAGAIASLLAPSLEGLTLVGLASVEHTITQLLEATRSQRLPARVELDGSCGDGDELVSLVKTWKERAPKSQLALGDGVRELIDANATAALNEAAGDPFASPFMPENHSLRARALWAKLA